MSASDDLVLWLFGVAIFACVILMVAVPLRAIWKQEEAAEAWERETAERDRKSKEAWDRIFAREIPCEKKFPNLPEEYGK
jgi:hypothetical protein